MLIDHLLTRSCTVTRRTDSGEINDYGDPVPDETAVETSCELQQLRRTEHEGDLSETAWLLVLPAGTEIGAGDMVAVDGTDYEVVGDPWGVRHPRTGALTHIEATCLRTA